VPEPSSKDVARIIDGHRGMVTAEIIGVNAVLDELLTASRDMAERGAYTPRDAAIEIDVLERAVDEGMHVIKSTFGRHRRAGA